MKFRKILSLLVLPAMIVLVSVGAEAFTTVQTDGTLDAVVQAQGRNGAGFLINKVVKKERGFASLDKKFPAMRITVEGQVLKTFKDPFTGITHTAGEIGQFQIYMADLNYKGLQTFTPAYQGYGLFYGMHPQSGLTSPAPGGLIPTVTLDGKSYAVPKSTKLLRDPEALKAMSASNLKALGTGANLSTAISGLMAPLEKIQVSAKMLRRVDATVEADGQQGDTGLPTVYKNFSTDNVSPAIEALGIKYYGEVK